MKTRLFPRLPYINKFVWIAVLCSWISLAGCVEKAKEAITVSSAERISYEEISEGTAKETIIRDATAEKNQETQAPRTAVENVAAEESGYPVNETEQTLVFPEKDSLVNVQDYIPDILVDLKYATTDNFTGQTIYDFTEAYLRYGTVERLRQAQDMLKAQGMKLKIWDAYRPVSAQFRLWEVCPDSTYVANPNKGYSSHSRGNTVDITLVCLDGTEMEMPTGFDDFSSRADRDYSDCGRVAAQNALLLENTMKQCGFKPYSGEWWHFSDQDSYSVEEDFEVAREP